VLALALRGRAAPPTPRRLRTRPSPASRRGSPPRGSS
jgi:hypothetical protein